LRELVVAKSDYDSDLVVMILNRGTFSAAIAGSITSCQEKTGEAKTEEQAIGRFRHVQTFPLSAARQVGEKDKKPRAPRFGARGEDLTGVYLG